MNAPHTGADADRAADAQPGHDAPDRARLCQLVDDQAALRRVATLVAGGGRPTEVFAAVADELGRLIGAEATIVASVDQPFEQRTEFAKQATVLGSYSQVSGAVPVGYQLSLEPEMIATAVLRTGLPARINGGRLANGPCSITIPGLDMRAVAAAPIVVGGCNWGVTMAATSQEDFPADTESRMTDFMDLAAMAISNAQNWRSLETSRDELARLLAEQAALRRVATLVARGIDPTEIFLAVAEEIRRLLDADSAGIARFEPGGGSVVAVGEGAGDVPVNLPIGTRVKLPDYLPPAVVWRTGHCAQVDEDAWRSRPEPFAVALRELGVRSMVASPVIVEGSLWGVVNALSTRGPFPSGTANRMAEFTDLVAAAVGNAESRAELAASRTRIVAAADETRRRIERDLHDGTQQRLVSLGLTLRLTQSIVPVEMPEFAAEIDRVVDELNGIVDDLREIARGIHPAILSEGGLKPALRTLARRAAIAVELDVAEIARLPDPIEVAAYCVVSEALTNTTRHARASVVEVGAEASGGTLRVRVRDDGVGGADPERGSGLVGLKDRVEALGGTFATDSPLGGGTTLYCELPVVSGEGQPDADPDR